MKAIEFLGDPLLLRRMRVLIMQGIPGSGKSTLVEEIKRHRPDLDLVVASADAYRYDREGVYRFDPGDGAHEKCLKGFIEAVSNDFVHDVVVVDNTNVDPVAVAPYHAVANAYGYDPLIVTVLADPALGAARNLHGVPRKTIDSMAQRIANFKTPRMWERVVIEDSLATPVPV